MLVKCWRSERCDTSLCWQCLLRSRQIVWFDPMKRLISPRSEATCGEPPGPWTQVWTVFEIPVYTRRRPYWHQRKDHHSSSRYPVQLTRCFKAVHNPGQIPTLLCCSAPLFLFWWLLPESMRNIQSYSLLSWLRPCKWSLNNLSSGWTYSVAVVYMELSWFRSFSTSVIILEIQNGGREWLIFFPIN